MAEKQHGSIFRPTTSFSGNSANSIPDVPSVVSRDVVTIFDVNPSDADIVFDFEDSLGLGLDVLVENFCEADWDLTVPPTVMPCDTISSPVLC